MFVRIARFEGAGDVDRQLDEIRKNIEEGRSLAASGDETDPRVAGIRAMSRTVVGFDRESRRLVGLVFCETADDLRKADEFLSEMSPGEGGGARSGVEMYEIGIDESTR